jgi:hypothetical protein
MTLRQGGQLEQKGTTVRELRATHLVHPTSKPFPHDPNSPLNTDLRRTDRMLRVETAKAAERAWRSNPHRLKWDPPQSDTDAVKTPTGQLTTSLAPELRTFSELQDLMDAEAAHALPQPSSPPTLEDDTPGNLSPSDQLMTDHIRCLLGLSLTGEHSGRTAPSSLPDIEHGMTMDALPSPDRCTTD